MDFLVSAADDGRLLRDFIKQNIRLSGKMLKYLKYQNDGILVNGVRCTVRRQLRAGDVVTLTLSDHESAEELLPVDLPLEILYEDTDLVAPSKPPNMPTHPSHNHHNDTLANALAFRYQQIGIPFIFRPINRLDRDTSGVLLIARNKLSAGILSDDMQNGRIQKTYLAILEGELSTESGVIDRPLHRTAESIIVREICSPDTPDAEIAVTEYRVLARGSGCSLVEAKPITGRTHQLRVHFASLGHPICGDTLYGIDNGRIPRQALHARKTVFLHPSTRERMTLTAPIPSDMKELITHCFPNYKF
ncbi:MAG: RluA family pseudouridine synthase [Clostridia bacterium]|nr:RluA family pseudouridine synthase [Clostridia bacterium]